jgi:phage baseplate assembly protein W
MAVTQKYGIKYPFTTDNDDGTYIDLNKTYGEGIQSQVLHVIFTPKGQKLRDPDFGTDLVKYIFSQSDSSTFGSIKGEISTQIAKYVPEVEFRDISIYNSEGDDNGIVVMVEYGVKQGNKTEVTKVAVKL